MNNKLEKFLGFKKISETTESVHINDRIGEITYRPMSTDEMDNYRDKCRDKNGNVNESKLSLEIMVNQIIEPDFSNAEFLKAVNCDLAKDYFKKYFTAGENDSIAKELCRGSGYFQNGTPIRDINEDIKAAKN